MQRGPNEPQDIRSELPEAVHHRQLLLPGGAVGVFSRRQSAASVAYHPQMTILLLLQCSSDAEVAGIHVQDVPSPVPGRRQDGRRHQPAFQKIKGLLAVRIPVKRTVVTSKVKQGAAMTHRSFMKALKVL